VFVYPLDIHLSCRGIQGWPKFFVEVFTVDALNQSFPVGCGFVHIPTQPGAHRLTIPTWKIAPESLTDSIREKFHSGGVVVTKSDLVYSGIERYKLATRSSGDVNVELMLIFKNFEKFGVELQ
jgi:B9 domain-containing protein 2